MDKHTMELTADEVQQIKFYRIGLIRGEIESLKHLRSNLMYCDNGSDIHNTINKLCKMVDNKITELKLAEKTAEKDM